MERRRRIGHAGIVGRVGSNGAYWPTRQGENSGQVRNAAVAQAFVLSTWQDVHESGISSRPAVAGGMNLNVWLRTITSPSICAIFGMWHPTHSLPADPR